MNSKKNSSAIYRYKNTEKDVTDNMVSSAFISSSGMQNKSAFDLFTKPLSYFKRKTQHKHYDVANTPYKISMDKVGNAYNVWCETIDAKISNIEKKQIIYALLLICDYAYTNKVELFANNIKQIGMSEIKNIYFNDVSVYSVIHAYKKSMKNDANTIKTDKIILSVIDDMFNNGVEISVNSVRAEISKLYPDFYYGCSIVSDLVKHYKSLHDIKHRTDCGMVLKSTNRKLPYKQIGAYVGMAVNYGKGV